MLGQRQRGLTAYIERFNGITKSRCAQLVSKSLSFSKSLQNHSNAIKYFICHYNLIKKDSINRTTRRNAHQMQYDTYSELGLMIGFGVIEAAHRTGSYNPRMKRSGQRWAKTGVDAMLKLRTRYESGRCSEVKKKVIEINLKHLNKVA